MASIALDLAQPQTRGGDYIERARDLRPLLEDAADEIEERRELPPRVVEALVAGGFFKLLIPRSLGGGELDPLTYVQVLEEIGRAEPGTASGIPWRCKPVLCTRLRPLRWKPFASMIAAPGWAVNWKCMCEARLLTRSRSKT